MKVEKIASGLQFTEGPAWSRDGFLLFSDCVTNKLHKFVPGVGGSDYANIPGGPNGKVLYVADSDARLIRAYDLNKAGAASNERIFAENIPGVPDGIRTDEKGNLYVAAKFVYVYSDDAKLIGTIELGETPSNLAFGDGDLEGLYVTARTFVFRVRIGVKGALQY